MRRAAEASLADWITSPRRKPLVLRGARQVGKSTLVRRVAESHGLPLWEVNLERHAVLAGAFESLDVRRILLEVGLVLRRTVGQGPGLLFLDEIQAIPQALTALRYFHEERPELPVIAAGSLLETALRRLPSAMPVGRIEFFHLGPVTFLEFVEATEGAPLADFLRGYALGEPWPDTVHERLRQRLRDFVIAGGMPEAAALFAESADVTGVHAVHRSILETYREDFGKYAAGAQIAHVRRVFDAAPASIGQTVKWSRVDAGTKSVDLRRAFELLEQAGVVTGVRHSAGTGVPLGATAHDAILKLLFLDVGLAQTAMGLGALTASPLDGARFVNEGPLAEQLAGQHLRHLQHGQRPELHFWRREGKAGNAEVDFLTAVDGRVVPVEVKAGAAGAMRSLHQFVALRGTDLAVRFDLNPPSIQEISTTASTPEGPRSVRYRLLSLPLFLAERVDDLVRPV
ncbi:MAG TPA: AAA family ATPase [Polyangiaceae bacterium]|nr:AAA family ATPase [Polyangiaceae bacterium]